MIHAAEVKVMFGMPDLSVNAFYTPYRHAINYLMYVDFLAVDSKLVVTSMSKILRRNLELPTQKTRFCISVSCTSTSCTVLPFKRFPQEIPIRDKDDNWCRSNLCNPIEIF